MRRIAKAKALILFNAASRQKKEEASMEPSQAVRVEIGNRVYTATSWKRKDTIYRGAKKIGVIKLSDRDRAGTTICIATSARKAGRAIDWCSACTP
jgi:hypothetical protein